ncbi:MAG: glycosyltransferase family 4 protein [Methylobacter sp.]|nr:glycosyltransferase family 4 protein [Methylobacter sp.]
MKILYHHRIASKDGQYVHIEELITALKNLGHEIIMAEPKAIGQKSFGKSSNTVQTIRRILPGFLHEIIEFFYTFLDFIKISMLIVKHKPDCIYERYNLFFPSGIWAKKLFKLPLLLEVNSPLYEERKKNEGIKLNFLAEWSERFTWRNADYVLPVTFVLAEKIKQKKVADDHIVVIPNGINRARFSNAIKSEDIVDQFNLNNKLVLGFVGFVREWHRLDRVLDAIANNKDKNWHLLLVGDGPARDTIEQQARQDGIEDRITITGIIDRDEISRYITVFDIALQPDVVAYASPLKLFEYMALSKAILAPDRDNIREILTHKENALLFDSDDDQSFMKHLLDLCLNKELRGRVGLAAAKTVEDKKLYWEENARRIETLFNQLNNASI